MYIALKHLASCDAFVDVHEQYVKPPYIITPTSLLGSCVRTCSTRVLLNWQWEGIAHQRLRLCTNTFYVYMYTCVYYTYNVHCTCVCTCRRIHSVTCTYGYNTIRVVILCIGLHTPVQSCSKWFRLVIHWGWWGLTGFLYTTYSCKSMYMHMSHFHFWTEMKNRKIS